MDNIHFLFLFPFFFSSPVPAVLTIKSSGTRFPAEFPPITRRASTRSISLVALAVDALAVSFTPWTPQLLPTLAASRVLLARRVVAVALGRTVPSHPARVAQTPTCVHVAHGVEAAVAVVVALRAPDPRVTCAFSCFLVALALLALTSLLALRSPAIVVTGTLPSQVVTLAIRIAVTFPLAVGPPELGRALCQNTKKSGLCRVMHRNLN